MSKLELFGMGYPRAYFFRSSESYAASGKYSFEEWEKIFVRLAGIQGKVLEEEVPGRSGNIPFFVKYKKRHPEKLVLLHYDMFARDPRDHGEKFFAGHWIYFNGCRITKDVPVEDGETEINVEDATLFHMNVGLHGDDNEDIGLCLLDREGKPDWHHSEQVQLISVDRKRNVIKVKRGCFGTKPVALPAGKSYAAAHVHVGPWGKDSYLLWLYNFSTMCPRDLDGRTCADILLDDLASHFVLGGDLECFDGLEFDVSHRFPTYGLGEGRGSDTTGDGKLDNGIIDGVNYYEIGLYDFFRRLRRMLGEDKIIQADGQGVHNQRCCGVLNGIESEGWPIGSDFEIEDWSGGINRHLFWEQNSRRPVFNYINYRWWMGYPKMERRPPPINITRLVLAAGQFVDAMICGIDHPEPEEGEELGIWDELRMGIEHRAGWLGFPTAPTVRLAKQTKDLLQGAGKQMTPEIADRLEGGNIRLKVKENELYVTAKAEGQDNLKFKLNNVPCQGPDLFVSLKIKAEPMKAYPIDIARLVWVGITRPKADKPLRFMTWANPNWFEAGFYFREVSTKKVDLEFEIEGNEPVSIKRLSVHVHPDAMMREFEHGLVLANPSLHDYAFNLGILTPRKKYCRLIGSSKQDPKTNDGSQVEGKITLGPRDGLFLTRTN